MLTEQEKQRIKNIYRMKLEGAYYYAKMFHSRRIFNDLQKTIEEYSQIAGMEQIISAIDEKFERELSIAYKNTLDLIKDTVKYETPRMRGCVL